MKQKLTVIVGLLLLIASINLVAIADSQLPGSGWWSGEQIQNVSPDTTANISLIMYDSAGMMYDDSATVAPGASYTFTPIFDFDNLPAGFQGSAVAMSNTPIKAIVNITNQPAGDVGVTGGTAAGQYQGFDGANVDGTLYFPLAKGDHFGKTTTFYIQNAGGTDATDVVATFNMRNGQQHIYNLPSFAANTMVAFTVFDSPTYNPVENNGRVGGLIVESASDHQLAGVVLEHDTAAAVAKVVSATRGFTASDFDNTAYAPVIKNNRFNAWTGLQVQNVGEDPIDISVDYTGVAGSCAGGSYQDTASGVLGGASATFVHYPGNTNLPENCVASATVSTDTPGGQFVAVVNEQEFSGSNRVAITYYAMPDGSATSKVSAPLFKDNRFSVTTGLQIQNVGESPTTEWSATFNCTTGGPFVAVSDDSKTGQIPAGGAYLFFTPSDDDLFVAGSPFANDNVVCSVTIEADQPIVAIANEGPFVPGFLDNNNYEGFNLDPLAP